MRATAAGVRPALTCEDETLSGKKRALTDKSKKKKPAAKKKPMSKTQGKKKANSKSGLQWYDSSDEEREQQLPVVRARIVHGAADSSASDSSPPYDSDVPGPSNS